jgi:hypothetical protein
MELAGGKHPLAARRRDRARLPLAVDLVARPAHEDHAGHRLLWFVVRREWRNLAIALGGTAAIVAVSFVCCRMRGSRGARS